MRLLDADPQEAERQHFAADGPDTKGGCWTLGREEHSDSLLLVPASHSFAANTASQVDTAITSLRQKERLLS